MLTLIFQFFAWVLRLIFSLMGLAFVLGLIVVFLLALIGGALLSLLRGQKPEVAVAWQRYQNMARARAPFGRWPGQAQNQGNAADIVDVQAKEIGASSQQPPEQLPPKKP
jgi:hypothetical protein